jgi:hypothetical protein
MLSGRHRACAAAAWIALYVCFGCSGSGPSSARPPASPVPVPVPARPAPLPSPTPPPGQDFAADARLLSRVLACVGDEPLPAGLDAPTVAAHCAPMRERTLGYRKRYLELAGPFLAQLRPADLPHTVVYPFGGGDLLSALTTYPEATEITTLSLEQSGDPRRIEHLDQRRLSDSLALIGETITPLLTLNDSTSANLMKGQRGEIPGQLGFFIVALAVHGFEPVSVRYFRIEDDGSLHYFSAAEIEAGDNSAARSLKGSWTPPDFAPVFANVEIAFRKAGGALGEPLRVHRHIGANLANAPLGHTSGLLRHLEAKGQVVAMTKAASYLLWRPDFSEVRNYLLAHAVFMISDSTGIPPEFAKAAGFQQETYGRFSGSFLEADGRINEQFRELWKGQPTRPLPFRYGYVDAGKHYHLLVTRKTSSS